MDEGTIFYVAGAALAVSAVLFSFLGLKLPKFPGRAAPLVVIWFVALIGVASTFAVLHSQHEEEAHEQDPGLQHGTEKSERAEGE